MTAPVDPWTVPRSSDINFAVAEYFIHAWDEEDEGRDPVGHVRDGRADQPRAAVGDDSAKMILSPAGPRMISRFFLLEADHLWRQMVKDLPITISQESPETTHRQTALSSARVLGLSVFSVMGCWTGPMANGRPTDSSRDGRSATRLRQAMPYAVGVCSALWVGSWYLMYLEVTRWHHVKPSLAFKSDLLPANGIRPHPGLPLIILYIVCVVAPLATVSALVAIRTRKHRTRRSHR